MKNIAIDIGNVCLNIRFDKCLAALELKSGIRLPPELLSATDSMERGRLSEDDWLTVFMKKTNGKFSLETLKKAYNAIIDDEIRETRGFVELATKTGHGVIFFSDTSRIHLDHILANLSFAHLVTGGVYSFEVGTKKPEPAMFAEFEKRYGLPSLYLDDKLENIQGGIDAGWPSLQFKAGEKSAETLYDSIE
ncbi:MAG: hypothetical protein GXP32_03645 [Kiritimatiellaeota bacterium]|nr:hypothetical protein [Kiritimatiellota bacterium]